MKKALFVLLSVFVISCSLVDLFNQVQVKVIQKDAAYKDVLLLSSGKGVVGLDPETYEVKISIEFNTYTGGIVTYDDKLFVGDAGKRVGDFGNKIYVLDKKGKLIHEIEALPNPLEMKVVDNLLIASSHGFYTNGNSAFCIFNIETYEKVEENRDITYLLAGMGNIEVGNSFFLGVEPKITIDDDKKAYFLKYNKENLNKETITSFNEESPYHLFDYTIYNNYLIIVYQKSHEIHFVNLETGKIEKTFDLKDYIEAFNNDPKFDTMKYNQISAYDLMNPHLYNGLLYVQTGGSPDYPYQSIVVIDPDTQEFLKEIVLSNERCLGATGFNHIAANKVLFDTYLGTLYLYSLEDGSFIKDIVTFEL